MGFDPFVFAVNSTRTDFPYSELGIWNVADDKYPDVSSLSDKVIGVQTTILFTEKVTVSLSF